MRLRVMTDSHTAFLFSGSEVKAFVTGSRGEVYWGIMPNGPAGWAKSPEEAFEELIAAFESGDDQRLATTEDVTEEHLPAIRKRHLDLLGYLDVGVPASGVRAIARKVGERLFPDRGECSEYRGRRLCHAREGGAFEVSSPGKASQVFGYGLLDMRTAAGAHAAAKRYIDSQSARRLRGHARTTAFEQERGEMKAWLDARSRPAAARVAHGRYRVAYLSSRVGSGTWRSYVDGDFTLEGAVAQMGRIKRRGMTAWVEDSSGNHVPVPGAMRPIRYGR
jgi:hypothetical protein